MTPPQLRAARGLLNWTVQQLAEKVGLDRNTVAQIESGRYASDAETMAAITGNAWEWVEDCFHPNYSGAPEDGSAWTTGGDCTRRMLRGASWYIDPGSLTSAHRGLLNAD